MSCLRALAFAPALIIVTACAARGPSPALLAELGRADALVREGCHACLMEALDVYERLAEDSRRASRARYGAFEAALLLAIRARELGLPAGAPMARARQWAERIDRVDEGMPIPGLLLDAADVIAGDLSGLDPEARQARSRQIAARLDAGEYPHRADLDAAIDRSLAAAYLALAIDCENPKRRWDVDAGEVLAQHGGPPLMRYRLGICGVPRLELLAPLREQEARWTDTLVFEGRRELSGMRIDLRKAAELFAAAHAAFPDSPAILLAHGNAERARSRFHSALASYDAVIDVVPTHRDALLGRMVALSYLMRHDEGDVAATRLLDLGMWHVADAYYYRAWNRYHLQRLDAAWDDVERARALMSSTSVYTLSGLIAYGRRELDTALARFDQAFDMDATNCDAVWYAGLVHVDQRAWEPASPKFSRAMTCFTSAAAGARQALAALGSAQLHPEDLAAETTRLRTSSETSERRAAQAAYNAAQGYILLGERDLAASHLDTALVHPAMREKAQTLLKALEKPQPR